MDEVNIRIGRTGKEGMLEIVVEDNGVGMSPEQVELFNHFDYQKEKIETSIVLLGSLLQAFVLKETFLPRGTAGPPAVAQLVEKGLSVIAAARLGLPMN